MAAHNKDSANGRIHRNPSRLSCRDDLQATYFLRVDRDSRRTDRPVAKGLDCFRVLGPRQVGYLDLGGSGNETHAHLAADGRITIMFCNFEQPALILRIYGRERPILPQDAAWAALALAFTMLPGTRQIFLIDIESVQTSCGWGVPFMAFEHERDTLTKYHRRADRTAWVKKMSHRTRSIDGLPTRATGSLHHGGRDRRRIVRRRSA